jgi:hypothetical protein
VERPPAKDFIVATEPEVVGAAPHPPVGARCEAADPLRRGSVCRPGKCALDDRRLAMAALKGLSHTPAIHRDDQACSPASASPRDQTPGATKNRLHGRGLTAAGKGRCGSAAWLTRCQPRGAARDTWRRPRGPIRRCGFRGKRDAPGAGPKGYPCHQGQAFCSTGYRPTKWPPVASSARVTPAHA